MKEAVLLALVKKIVDQKLSDYELEIRTVRGPRGFRGEPGESFSLDAYSKDIKSWINDTKLTFDSLTEEEKASLKGDKGEDFVFETYHEEVATIIEEYIDSLEEKLKLKFDDLSDEEKDSLRLKFEDLTPEQVGSLRGPQGRPGKGFILEEHKEYFESLVPTVDHDKLRLKFSDLSIDEVLELKGERGPRGQRGKGFVFEEHKEYFKSLVPTVDEEKLKLKFSDLKEEEKQELKLNFSDLTEEEVSQLRGPKGKPGKNFVFEEHKEYFKSLAPTIDYEKVRLKFSDLKDTEKEELKLKFEDLNTEEIRQLRGARGARGQRGKDGKSIIGPPGAPGIMGRPGKDAVAIDGKDGVDGKDAPEIVDIDTIKTKKGLLFVFHFSDGTSIHTNSVELPKIEKMIGNIVTMVANQTPSNQTAAKLVIPRVADEAISIGEAVSSVSPTNVQLASADSTVDDATVLGIAVSAAAIGETVNVLVLGVISDPSFSVFTLNDVISLDVDGGLRNDKIGSGFFTVIGKSLGGNDILVSVQDPVALA